MQAMPRTPIFAAQVVPSALAPRVLLFRWPLAITSQWEQLAPGFFDAPGTDFMSPARWGPIQRALSSAQVEAYPARSAPYPARRVRLLLFVLGLDHLRCPR